MDKLSLTTKALLRQIDSKCAFDEICQNLKEEHLSEEQVCTIILWLVQRWICSLYRDVSGFERYSYAIPKKLLNIEHVLKIVKNMSCEKLFCQVLLLLPEEKKSVLLPNICQYLLQAKHNNLVCEHLVKEAFTTYSQNFMYRINTANFHLQHLFINNCTTILKLAPLIPSMNVYIHCFYLLENVLLNFPTNLQSNSFQLDKYDDCSKSDVSVLNKKDMADVQKLRVLCKKILSSEFDHNVNVAVPPELNFSEFSGLFSAVLIELTDRITVEDQDLKKIELILCDTLLHVLVQLKTFILTSDQRDIKEKDSLHEISKRFFYQCSKQFSEMELVEYVCRSSDVNEIAEMVQVFLDTDQETLVSLWEKEQNMEKKFSKATIILNNLYCCHSDVLNWILDYEFLMENQCQDYASCLKTYCVNYGTLSLVEKILLVTRKCKLVNEKSLKYKCLQGVLLDVLSYVSIPSCNELLNRSHKIYQSDDAFPWLRDFEQLNIMELTETINKLSDEENPSLMSKIGRFCLISPKKTLVEVIQRIFCGNLSSSIAIKVLEQFPSLLNMQLYTEYTIYPSVFYIIKECYCRYQKSNDAFKILSQLFSRLLKVFSEESQDAVFCIFIVPNLQEKNSEGLFDKSSTLLLLNSCLQACSTPSVSVYILLLRSLFHDESTRSGVGVESSPRYVMDECFHKCRRLLVDRMSSNFEVLKLSEQEQILDTVKTLAKQLSWTAVLYFYEFFCGIGYLYQYPVPVSLFRFCNLADNPFWLECPLNVTEKWVALLQVGLRSLNVLTLILQCMPDVEADEEIPNIIEAVTSMFAENVQKFTGTLLVKCLRLLVEHKKIKDINTFFSRDLQDATECHGLCFALFILLQVFLSLYCDVSCGEEAHIFSNVECYVTLLHDFVNYSKDISDVKVRVHFIMYFTEQLVYLSTILNEVVTNHLSLLAMNMVKVVTENLHFFDKKRRDVLMEEYEVLLNVSSNDFCILLKNKFLDDVVHLKEKAGSISIDESDM